MCSKLKLTFLFVALLFVINSSIAQPKKKRLQPGKRYASGEKIYAPKYGFETVIPAGWDGTFPRESEVFSLMPTTPIGGQVFAFSSVLKDLNATRSAWLKGIDLSETIKIKATEDAAINGDMLTAEVVPSGESVNTGYKGYAISRCSPFGPCVTCLGIAPTQFFDQVKAAVTTFMTQAVFSEPKDISIYVDFNWKEFLTGKMLIAYATIEGGSKENTVHLCADGTFNARFDKKGMFKNDNEYNGKQSGTWTAEGVGENGKLILNFNKLPKVEVALFIKDDQITANGERYFAGESDKCK